MYKYSTTTQAENRFLSMLSNLLTEDQVELFHEVDSDLGRVSFDGIVTLTGRINGKNVGVVVSDFRVGGASFSKKNSKRVSAFVKQMGQLKYPIIFILNSLGVRFMEGRTVFDDAFSIISDLYHFRKENLLICIGLGKTLGISALFFAQGHYRIALKDETQINLTGPEVHKRFFGNVDADFSEFTLADHQFGLNSLVHEILPSPELIYRSAQDIISFLYQENYNGGNLTPKFFSGEMEQGGYFLRNSEDEKLKELEFHLGDHLLELYPQRSPVVRVYLGRFMGNIVGYLVNPPGHPNNMLTVRAIDKCIAAMEFFKAIQAPVITLLDCPGGDPRKAESDKDAIMKMIELTHQMIAYPFGKMGIIIGRCFGGSGMFSFPKIYGGKRVLAVKGAQMGVMHRNIIEDLLSGASRLKEAWLKVAASEVPSLEDMVEQGTIDRVIEKHQIRAEIQRFLYVGSIMNMKENSAEETVQNGEAVI